MAKQHGLLLHSEVRHRNGFAHEFLLESPTNLGVRVDGRQFGPISMEDL
jgi:hypothetical protein